MRKFTALLLCAVSLCLVSSAESDSDNSDEKSLNTEEGASLEFDNDIKSDPRSRRRRRKMFFSTTKSPLLKKAETTEPKFTVRYYMNFCFVSVSVVFLFQMKPSTEILKRDLAEKNRLRQKGSRFKEYQNRKRRFKPQNPRFNKSKNSDKSENIVTTPFPNKNLLPDKLIPESFPKFDIIKTDVDTGIKINNSSDLPLSPLQSPLQHFETTNMERNRVVLLDSQEESVDKELPPKFLLSTTSSSLSSDEKDFISQPMPTWTKAGFDQNELLKSDFGSYDKKEENKINSVDKPVIKLGVSIEEVESATDINKVMNDDTQENKVTDSNDMADQSLYR